MDTSSSAHIFLILVAAREILIHGYLVLKAKRFKFMQSDQEIAKMISNMEATQKTKSLALAFVRLTKVICVVAFGNMAFWIVLDYI